MNKRQIMLIVSIVAILIVVLATILTYNSLVRKEQSVERTWDNIEAAYQMRIDKIPLVLSAVNSSMTFERSLLENITLLRTQWLSEVGKDVAANVNTTQQLDSKINALLHAINENYPILKSIQVVQDFIAIVDETENIILAQRVFYNDSVASYNSAVRGFPAGVPVPVPKRTEGSEHIDDYERGGNQVVDFFVDQAQGLLGARLLVEPYPDLAAKLIQMTIRRKRLQLEKEFGWKA